MVSTHWSDYIRQGLELELSALEQAFSILRNLEVNQTSMFGAVIQKDFNLSRGRGFFIDPNLILKQWGANLLEIRDVCESWALG